MLIGIVGDNGSASAAMRLGMMLVLQVPIATEMLARNIKVTYSLMVLTGEQRNSQEEQRNETSPTLTRNALARYTSCEVGRDSILRGTG